MTHPAIDTLVLLLGDQLTSTISSLQHAEKDSTIVLMGEIKEEASYVNHHKKKIAFVFSAMRHFCDELTRAGWQVEYLQYDKSASIVSVADLLRSTVKKYPVTKVLVTEPGEYRLTKQLEKYATESEIPVQVFSDERFICSKEQFKTWAQSRKQLRMEYFYRDMRRETGLLMDGAKPLGGKWNFDADNRRPAKQGMKFTGPRKFKPDEITQQTLALVAGEFSTNFGDLEPFWFGVTREDAKLAWQDFLSHSLPYFGDYQDAMLSDERFLFHSAISHYLNIGLLDALDISKQVEKEYLAGRIPLNAAEGFIRQIIGWREYVRAIYWWRMPEYLEENYFAHDRPLPDFYWTGETRMRCLAESIGQTKEEAYAHHIQRLMLTGNFAMLIGTDPKAVHEWYLGVYADAYEWVELPNTLGMSQFADGGLLGSKPYASGGNYINKMSNYCASCEYKIKEKTGDSACPFNYLYWNFLIRHRKKLESNQRLSFVYRTLDKMSAERVSDISNAADVFIQALHRSS